MDLRVTVAFTPDQPVVNPDNRLVGTRAEVDVVASVQPGHTASDLASSLARVLGLRSARSIQLARAGRVPADDTEAARLDLLDGDTITLLDPNGDSIRDRSSESVSGEPAHPGGRDTVMLDVLAGADAGRSLTLHPGVYFLGRGADQDIRFHDPHVSRSHCEISVGDDGSTMLIADPAGPEVLVNAEPVSGSIDIGPADIISIGTTRLCVRSVEARPGRVGGGVATVDFHRTPYRAPESNTIEIEPFGPVPKRPEPRRFGVITVLAPLAGGLLLFSFTRQPTFLLMMALSPIMAIGNAIEDRRSGKRDARRQVANFHTNVERRRNELIEAGRRERLSRGQSAPDFVECERRATNCTTELWIRHRASVDSGLVRVGTGPAKASFDIEVTGDGDEDLAEHADRAFAGLDQLRSVPATVHLFDNPVTALHGPDQVVYSMVSSMIVQLAVLQSPEDLLIAAALGPTRGLDWLKWLPHVRPVGRHLATGHVARDDVSARRLITALLDLVDRRVEQSEDDRHPIVWPRVVVVIDAQLELDLADCDRLVEQGPSVGVSVVWLATDVSGTVRRATRVIELAQSTEGLRGRIWATDPTIEDVHFEPELIFAERAEAVARALAPLRDATARTGSSQIPAIAPLCEVHGIDRPTSDWITQRWSRSNRQHLTGKIGFGADGPIEIDLVDQGPHALIGGTSGSGKSELLQSMVAGLAADHPPNHLNFLFIDYKGGAATQTFERLPHTVGIVTNLEASLAMRALASLRAELDYRMRMLEGRAKDIMDLAKIDPNAPPSLVIIVDEFATLVNEIPEFVAGIVDVAQRGRSLGIHLVLATQRPAGAVNDNILANTNLRIALRALDRPDSTAIIDTPDAARIPPEQRGRALMRVGPSSLIEVQSAYGSAPLEQHRAEPIRLGVFDRPDAVADTTPIPAPPQTSVDERTQLDAMIDACVDANREIGLAPPRLPWCEPLDEVVPIETVRGSSADLDSPTSVVLGLADHPERQLQQSFVFDLAAEGGLMVFGSSGAGKSTLLRTIAAELPDEVTVFGFDGGARGLTMIAALDNVVDVATTDNLEAVTRHITVLEAEVERRRGCDDAQAEPPVVILIDNWGSIVEALEEASPSGRWVERFQQTIADGRSANIFTVLTSDRRAAVSARLHSAIGARLIMRHADESAYLDHGIASVVAKDLNLPPGRALWNAQTLMQVAVVGDDPSTAGQRDSLAKRASGTRRLLPLTSFALGESAPLPTPTPVDEFVPRITIGVADISGVAATIDLESSNLLIAGPPGSGRSTAIAATAVSALQAGYRVGVIALRSKSLQNVLLPLRQSGLVTATEPDQLTEFVEGACKLSGRSQPLMVLIDDVDLIEDSLAPALDQLVGRAKLIGSCDIRAVTGFSMQAVVNELRRARRTVLLQPDDPAEFMQITGMRSIVRPGVQLVRGRAVLVSDRTQTVIQVADVVNHPVAVRVPALQE